MNKEFRIFTNKEGKQIIESREVSEWKERMTLEEIMQIFKKGTSNVNFTSGLTIRELRGE